MFMAKRCVAAITVLLLLITAGTASAADWITKGGSPLRQSSAAEDLGLFKASEWWRLEDLKNDDGAVVGPGQSAAQPVVAGDYIYHLAGKYLWRIKRVADKGAPSWEIVKWKPVNVDSRPETKPEDKVKVPASTPTYSPESGMLYFGTGYGTLWGYDTRQNEFRSVELSGCPIVTSPLVLRTTDGRDLVVVGDKQDRCSSGAGNNVWVVWGLDASGGSSGKAGLLLGGWVTPSPIPDNSPYRFIVGADGVNCRSEDGKTWEGSGVVQMLQIFETGSDRLPYMIDTVDWGARDCQTAGQAGSFASTDQAVYWVDVNAQLHARKLKDGTPPDNWPTSLDLPALIGGAGSKGFTNTEPAIDPVTRTLVVTLRNYKGPNAPLSLRGCGSDYPKPGCTETGAPGAVIALNLDTPAVKWKAHLPPGAGPDSHPSINTAPLILTKQNAVIFGDVNGTIHSYTLKPYCDDLDVKGAYADACATQEAIPRAMALDDACKPLTTVSLLAPNETPARGKETWSQVSGVGTDPMIVAKTGDQNPLILMGVNYAPPSGTPDKDAWLYGRLVAFRSLNPYNLRWTVQKAQPITIAPGQPVQVGGTVELTMADQPLGALRSVAVPVRWALARSENAIVPADFHRNLAVTGQLPMTLGPGQAVASAATVTLNPDDPAEGYIVGIIDADQIVRRDGKWGLVELGIRDAFQLFEPPCPSMTAAEVALTDNGRHSQLLGYVDNFLWIPYKLKPYGNLKLSVEAPPVVNFAPASSYTVTFRITNEGLMPATVPLTAEVRTGIGRTWSLGARNVTVAPGETVTQTRKVNILACRDTMVVSGTLNPEPRIQEEPTYDDNAAAAMTRTGECDAAPGSGNASGETRVIIVPDNCKVNPDWSSRQPCLNYPGMLIP